MWGLLILGIMVYGCETMVELFFNAMVQVEHQFIQNTILALIHGIILLELRENIFKLYIDGVLIGSSTGNASGTLDTSNDPITFGYAGFHTYFKGFIKEARFWSIARTQNQIQNAINGLTDYNEVGLSGYWPMNDGTGTQIDDLSPSNYNGTLNGGIWGGETVEESGLSNFDDIDDFNNFIIEEIEGHAAYGAEVQVDYVNLSSKFRVVTSNPSEYKRVVVSIKHSSFLHYRIR